jgi:hypothetical protein
MAKPENKDLKALEAKAAAVGIAPEPETLANGATPEPPGVVDAAPAEPVVDEISDAELIPMIKGGMAAIGGILCKRANVSALDAGEVDLLADSGLRVIKVYGWHDKLNPKVAAWIGLIGALGAVLTNRQPLALPKPEKAKTEPDMDSEGVVEPEAESDIPPDGYDGA